MNNHQRSLSKLGTPSCTNLSNHEAKKLMLDARSDMPFYSALASKVITVIEIKKSPKNSAWYGDLLFYILYKS